MATTTTCATEGIPSRLGRGCAAWAVCSLLLLLPAGTSATRADDAAPTEPALASDGGTAAGEDSSEEGMVARFGSVTASFRVFGDTGAQYDSSGGAPGESRASFLTGSIDFFSSARLDDHVQTLAEVVGEFDDNTNEIGFELERLWGMWSESDAFYVKLGREHAPVSHWDRRFHHGRIFWPAVTQPFLARFEDQGGPLPVHQVGVEIGGTLHTRAGDVGYVGVVSNGRGFNRTEVENVTDRNTTKAWDAGVTFSPSGAPALLIGGNYRHDWIPADPASAGAIGLRESIVSLFGEWRSKKWYALGEYASIHHDGNGPIFDHASGYLEVNYRHEKLEPYARVDVREMAEGDPFYVDGDLDLDRWDGLVGLRIDLGDHADFKVEGGYGRAEERDTTGVLTRGPVAFGGVALQWMF